MAKAEKRRINTKVALTNLFMAVSVVAIVAALTLVAMGYRLEGGELTQYGLLQVASIPSGAGVEVDGVRVDRTEMSEMMPNGKHELVVTKSGYDTWRGEINIKSGLLKRVDYVRLFPIKKVVEAVDEYKDLVFVSAMPTRNGLLVVRSGGKWTVIESVDSKTVKQREIQVPEWVAGQEIAERKWNRNGDRLFVKVGEQWGVVDLRTDGESINITQEFSMAFSDIVIANDAGDKLYGLENGNIRVVDLRGKSVSGVKVAGVTTIGGEDETVGYTQVKDEKWTVGVFRDGESAGKAVFQPKIGAGKVMAWRYWGDDIVAGVVDGELVVNRGVAYGEMDEIARIEIGEVGAMSVSPSGRFFVVDGWVVDVSSGKTHETSGGGWLDDFMMYAVAEGKLAVWDFDGGNERVVGEAAEGEAMISRGNGWLYFVEAGSSKVVREKL